MCVVLFSYLIVLSVIVFFFFFSSRRRHTRLQGDWSSDVCSSDLAELRVISVGGGGLAYAGLLDEPQTSIEDTGGEHEDNDGLSDEEERSRSWLQIGRAHV